MSNHNNETSWMSYLLWGGITPPMVMGMCFVFNLDYGTTIAFVFLDLFAILYVQFPYSLFYHSPHVTFIPPFLSLLSCFLISTDPHTFISKQVKLFIPHELSTSNCPSMVYPELRCLHYFILHPLQPGMMILI